MSYSNTANRVVDGHEVRSNRPVATRAGQEAPPRTAKLQWTQTHSARAPLARSSASVVEQHQLVEQLHLEERRADRTKAPLSIAVFDLDEAPDAPVMQEFLRFLTIRKRETDTLGFVAANRVALVLPDTNTAGVEALVDQIKAGFSTLALHTSVATYPKQTLDGVLTRPRVAPASVPGATAQSFPSERRVGYPLKRALDLCGSIVLLVLLTPVMLATAAAVALTSRGPVIFKQKRLGERGLPFVFYKFRSMTTDADDRLHREYVTRLISGETAALNQGDHNAPLFKIKVDPRVTRVGKIIRKTSIDELPQLFNVLKGEMSLVGPRPPLPYEAEKYQSWHKRRVLDMKPGITGLWQVEGRSRTSFDDMVRLDLRYIEQCSLWLDLKILLKTVRVVLTCNGAR